MFGLSGAVIILLALGTALVLLLGATFGSLSGVTRSVCRRLPAYVLVARPDHGGDVPGPPEIGMASPTFKDFNSGGTLR